MALFKIGFKIASFSLKPSARKAETGLGPNRRRRRRQVRPAAAHGPAARAAAGARAAAQDARVRRRVRRPGLAGEQGLPVGPAGRVRRLGARPHPRQPRVQRGGPGVPLRGRSGRGKGDVTVAAAVAVAVAARARQRRVERRGGGPGVALRGSTGGKMWRDRDRDRDRGRGRGRGRDSDRGRDRDHARAPTATPGRVRAALCGRSGRGRRAGGQTIIAVGQGSRRLWPWLWSRQPRPRWQYV